MKEVKMNFKALSDPHMTQINEIIHC